VIRNVLDSPLIVLFVILGLSTLLSLWLRHRRGYSNAKASALFLVVFCSGYFLLFVFFVIEPSLAPSAEIQGQVSQINLRYPIGRKGDHSQFQVTSPSGLRVTLDSEHHLAEGLEPGEAVYVRYDPLTLDPYRVERLDGSKRQLLLENRLPRWMTLANWAMLVLLAALVIYHARKFRLEAS
jgi:hypothetical protein